MSDCPTIRFYVVFMICDVVYALSIYVILHMTYLSYDVEIDESHRILRHFWIAWLVVHVFAAIPFSWAVFVMKRYCHFLILSHDQKLNA
jgi:hypothetical protein